MNMTDNPNQQTRPTIFGFPSIYPSTVTCAYPSSSNVCETTEEASAFIPGQVMTSFSSSPFYMDGQFSVPSANNYSFYSNFNNAPSPVTFPLTPTNNFKQEHFNTTSQTLQFGCKRKTDSPPPVVTKQHITEERMAEHLSKLHISSESPQSANEAETSDIRERRLYMCEEMRKLQAEPIIPTALLKKLESPCTALVLWTPPPRMIPLVSSENEDDNNNEETMLDNNGMELDMR